MADASNDTHVLVQQMLSDTAAASLPDHIFPSTFCFFQYKVLLVQYVSIGVCRCFETLENCYQRKLAACNKCSLSAEICCTGMVSTHPSRHCSPISQVHKVLSESLYLCLYLWPCSMCQAVSFDALSSRQSAFVTQEAAELKLHW